LDLFLNLIQIVISVALIILILIQSKGSGMGSLFGGGGDSGVYTTRRGVEKTLFNLTVVVALTFFLVAILNVIASS
jgi:preprotein translocase subunit SecG